MGFDFSKYKDDPNFCVYCESTNVGVHDHYTLEMTSVFINVSCHECGGDWTEEYVLSAVSYEDKPSERVWNDEVTMTMEDIYGS